MDDITTLPRTSPESQGVSSAKLLEFVDALDKQVNGAHGVMLLRHGNVIAEGWWAPHGPQIPHMLFSLTKSFTSTAVGFAVSEGLFSVDDKVISFFPDQLPARVSKNLAAMTVHHLLSMSTGHTEDPTGKVVERKDGDWIRGFFSVPVKHAPGAPFVYNSAASHMLSAIVQKRSGLPTEDYLTPRLFAPLGIRPAYWQKDPMGISTGGWGLNLRIEEIARFGQFLLQKGAWNGVQLLPAEWIEKATSKQVSNGDDPQNDWNQGYGYQFWRCRHNIFRGDGAFGQYCIVMPDQEAVLAMNFGTDNMQAVLNVVWDKLLPAIQDTRLNEAPRNESRLRKKLGGLKVPDPVNRPVAASAAQWSGKTWKMAENKLKLRSVRLKFLVRGVKLTFAERGRRSTAEFGYKGWKFGESALLTELLPKTPPRPVAAHAAWLDENTLELTLRCYTTPFVFTLLLKFAGDALTMEIKPNLSLGPTDMPVLEGKMA